MGNTNRKHGKVGRAQYFCREIYSRDIIWQACAQTADSGHEATHNIAFEETAIGGGRDFLISKIIAFLTWALDGRQWSVSRPRQLHPPVKSTGIHRTGMGLGGQKGMSEVWFKRNI